MANVLRLVSIVVVAVQGASIAERSSELLCQGDVAKLTSSGWRVERVLFLFDCQLVYCKRVGCWLTSVFADNVLILG